MKINAFRNKDAMFTADLWKVTVGTDASGGPTYSYAFDRAVTFTASTGQFGKLDIWLDDSYDDVVAIDQLFNVYGPDGNELMKDAIWQFDTIAPYINMWGHREGFKARLARIGSDA